MKTLVQEGDNCSWHVFALFFDFCNYWSPNYMEMQQLCMM